MTVGQLLERLLAHFSPEERSIPSSTDYPGRNEAALGAINSAMQTLFGSTSPWCRRDFEGAWLHEPETITVTVTQGSKEITFSSWDDRYAGCSIRIDGATADNRVHGADPETSDTTLVLPHDGSTGTTTATIYHDSLTLPDYVAEILRPVQIRGVGFLAPVGSPSQMADPTPEYEDYGIHEHNVTRFYSDNAQTIVGKPRVYCVDTHQHDIYAAPKARLRLAPAPDAQMLLEYRIRYAVPVYEAQDFGMVLPVPLQYEETLLVPIAQHHLTRCPFFRDDSSKQAIADGYQAALSMLAAMNPQGASGGRLLAQF